MAKTSETLDKAQQLAMEARIRAGMMVSDYRRGNIIGCGGLAALPSTLHDLPPILHRRLFRRQTCSKQNCGRLETRWSIEVEMDAISVLAALKAIREADPVADLAKDLLDAGVTEEQLHGMLRGRMNDPITLELYNKYRDISRSGFTVNRYGVTRRL